MKAPRKEIPAAGMPPRQPQPGSQPGSLSLFLSFAKIGLFTFGGGYAMIPLIQDEVVRRRGWVAEDEFLELLTLAQSAPGAISINTSVFVGYRINGIKGALASITGTVLPSFAVILVIAIFFSSIKDNPGVEAVFKGMRPAVVGLIIAPIFTLSKGLDAGRIIAAVIAVAAAWYFGFSPIYLIIVGAAGGLLYGLLTDRRK